MNYVLLLLQRFVFSFCINNFRTLIQTELFQFLHCSNLNTHNNQNVPNIISNDSFANLKHSQTLITTNLYKADASKLTKCAFGYVTNLRAT